MNGTRQTDLSYALKTRTQLSSQAVITVRYPAGLDEKAAETSFDSWGMDCKQTPVDAHQSLAVPSAPAVSTRGLLSRGSNTAVDRPPSCPSRLVTLVPSDASNTR
eukprot:Hpha_TRINITY_DN35360_c0_g1::TRINITY_DN35360_c0_g1_i1::g.85148::m.85148